MTDLPGGPETPGAPLPPPAAPPPFQYGPLPGRAVPPPPPPPRARRWVTGLAIIGALYLISSVIRAFMQHPPVSDKPKVALINILGPIVDMKKQVDLIAKYREDASIKAILLRIDTPGGVIGATQELVMEMTRARKDGKVIVASLGNVAASGGYYVACAADHIIADPGTLTGSIGVIMSFANLEDLFKKIGLRMDVVKSGRFKDVGSPARKLTQEEERVLQEMVDDVFGQFVGAIAEHRGTAIKKILADARKVPVESLTAEDVRAEILKVADGRVFSGTKAMTLGLVDELGNFHDAVRVAGERGGIAGKPELLPEPKKTSPLEWLVGEEASARLQGMLDWVPVRYQLSL